MIEEKIVIKKNSEVTKILTEKNKVIGVEINQNKKGPREGPRLSEP